jgi:hypothetical protein
MPEYKINFMCPHCGWRVDVLLCDRLAGGKIPAHDFDGERCPGSLQTGRHPHSDKRPLWKDEVPMCGDFI